MGRKLVIGWAFRSIKDNGCPLFAIEPTVNNVGDLLAIVKRVTQNQVVETSCWFESGQGHQSCICSVRDSKPDVAGYAYSTPSTGATTPNAVRLGALCCGNCWPLAPGSSGSR